MKKISLILLSIFLAVSGVFLAACGKDNIKDIQLSQSQVVIYLGETENNKEVVNALPININVESLSIFYDRTNITITSSAKKADGSFDLFIVPNGEQGCEDVEVTVRAGAHTEKKFLVAVVVPVADIVAETDISIAYSGKEMTCNLLQYLTFLPDTTKQKNVVFELLTEGLENKAAISGNNLMLSSDFDYFTDELRIVVQSLDRGGIRKEFGVKVVPSARYFAAEMEMFRIVGGAELALDDNGYVLNIENGTLSEPFEIGIRIPSSLNIDVNINSTYGEQTNIMGYLSHTKTSEIIAYKGGQYLEVVFEFESLNIKTGVGYLFFEFYYTNNSNKNLNSMFVITETKILDALSIEILVPLQDISVETLCERDPGGAYIVYKNYSQIAKGSAFIINALPNNTTEKELVLSSIVGVDVYVWSTEESGHILLEEGAIIISGQTILVAGQQDVEIGKIIISKKMEDDGVSTVNKTIDFAINSGASALGFVENEADFNPTTKKEVAVECGDEQGVSVLLYAPNTTHDDLTYEQNMLIVPKTNGYYEIVVVSNTIGSKEYIISTANGFEVVLIVQTIQPLESVDILIKNNNLEGVGKSIVDGGSVVSVSVKNGFSVELEYNINTGAEVAEIEYGFADAILGSGQYISAYAPEYINFSKDSVADFFGYSEILSTSNIKDANIITALADGKVVIKVLIYGYVVEMGKVVKTSDPIEKFICVEVYRPIKDITSTGKTIELRAQNQLSDTDYDKSTKVIDLSVIASGNKAATYNKIYIDGATYIAGNNLIEYVYENENADGKMSYKATLDIETNQLTVVVYSIPSNYDLGTQNIVLFATDFYFETDCNLNFVKQEYEVITYPINIHILETRSITDINISSLKLEKVEHLKENVFGEEVLVKTKTYERVYLDVSNASSNTNVYKLITEVLPIDAFNKELKYWFVPDANCSSALVDVSSNDGFVYYSDSEGGTGYIYISPKNSNSIKVVIPVTVTDGSSWATAFKITSLTEIKNPNKHYIISTLSTLELTSTLFNGQSFKGGLYGNREGETQQATIKLNGCSLFDVISAGAKVQNITLYGDVTASGFVANINHGTIQNVCVTTYILNGVYVPSLLTAKNLATNVGGLVGVNTGSIIDCEFAGSIKKSTDAENVHGIAGEDSGIISTNTIITVAKFENVGENTGRVILVDGSYINGVLEPSGSLSGSQFTGVVSTGDQLDGKEYINTIALPEGGYKTLGDINSKYGIMFYFAANDVANQQSLNKLGYNTLKKEDLVASSCKQIKLVVVDKNGASSNIATVSGDNLTISGVGEFVLRIYSAHDYTTYVSINMASVYYFSEFGIYNDGKKIETGDKFTILKGGRDTVYSQTTQTINGIDLKQNLFVVNFTLNGDRADNYITGRGIGEHTINAVWTETDSVLLVNIATGYNVVFDTLINNAFCNGDNYAFKILLKLGTSKVETSAESGSIEPKDGIPFNAIITTDIDTDKVVGGDNGTIEIINANGHNCTDAFNVYVGEQKVFGNSGNQYSFEIVLSLKDKNRQNREYVDKTYTVRIRVVNTAGEKYAAYATYKLTILPQSLADIGVALYNFQSSDDSGHNVSDIATPTSVLLPTQSGLLSLNLFPNYTTFDYVEIVATSNTLARLAFRVQKQTRPNHFEFDNTAKYEVLPDVNGIRLENNFAEVSNDADIGSYYILVFATNTLEQDAIFNLDINVYYRGDVLIGTTFTIFVRIPASPQVNINGKTSVYAYPGETLVANVMFPEDQVLTSSRIYNGKNIIDNIAVTSKHIATSGGFNQYELFFTIPKDYSISTSTSHITLKVSSLKADKGQQIEPKPAELQIYIVDFKIENDSIGIQKAPQGIFDISSIKYSNIELYANLLAYFEDGRNEAVDSFKNNYYFTNESGFSIPSEKDIENLKDLSKAEILSTYLYYVNGNQYAPISFFDNEGNIKIAPNNWYTNVLSFNFKEIKDEKGNIIDYKLQVRGGEATGEVPMLLQIHYDMPDGATYVYEYKFTFVNDLYTTEDMPIELTTSRALLDAVTAENAQDYILANDIYLYEYEVITDTSKIKSLDGNNYTIHIMSFADNQSTGYALFNTISAETTIKNLTVNYYYLDEVVIADEVTEVNFAGLAINNNGVVANTEVMTYVDSKEKTPTFTTFGIKVKTSESSTANINVAGFVLNNMGSISNSRVGGDQKLVTLFDYTIEDNPTLKEFNANAHMFTIRASGTISGFVYNNTGVISSSFAKNLNIINTYNKNQTKVSSGFVNTNEGTITMSYVEGEKDVAEIQALGGGIEATGIMAGFVYSNHGKIDDSYSNIMLHSSSNQVGRLGAGFVYYNSSKGVITSSYSFSSIGNNNTAQLNFAGVTDLMQYNNLGSIKNCYYYITEDMDSISIESMYNTEIQSITNPTSILNFYGFGFSESDYNRTATWQMSSTGPTLVSTNEIAHSVRYKVNKPQSGDTSLDYYYVYADEYDYGTRNNPIIIRNAKELNGVLGGYSGSNFEIEDNFDVKTGKVFGSYRLVNNIDLTELIIEENEDSDYKYNLSSTQMTLSGENAQTSNRPGIFNGNGLTISNLAISNSETAGGDNYGMFKTIENNATFTNVNIVLAKGGVKADNTACVGAIAGTLSNSSLINVNISTENPQEHTDIIGANLVGGAVGRVINNSFVFGVSVENVSVIATYFRNENISGDTGTGIIDNNTYVREEGDLLKRNSLAGGAFGVLDIYTQSQLEQEQDREDVADVLKANVQNVKITGGMTISGMTVGGVAGYIGKYVVAKDLALVITTKNTRLTAYNCFAGGIVGYNSGFIYQARVEHEELWQSEIEGKIGDYYKTTDEKTRQEMDIGCLELFQTTKDADVQYKPFAVGGIVGLFDRGTINVSYSKAHVRNDYSKYAGGVIGFINRERLETSNTSGNDREASLSQVYATGDVYAGGMAFNNNYIGGIIGRNLNSYLNLDKVNALNMWTYETLSESSTINLFVNDKQGMALDCGSFKAGEVKFDDKTFTILGLSETSIKENGIGDDINPYYEFLGLEADGGAQIDVAFEDNGWYDTDNWVRDIDEVYPHIRFNLPTSIYDIESLSDFWKFSYYGSNPDAKFIVTASTPIDCSTVQQTYSIIRGRLTGAEPDSGFANLSVPLFELAEGATISNLKFEGCSAPLVEYAEGGCRFTYLRYIKCGFAKGQNKENEYNYAGIAYKVDPRGVSIDFKNIIFAESCYIQPEKHNNNDSETVTNIGFIFARTGIGATGIINIDSISISDLDQTKTITLKNNTNLGYMVGLSEIETNITNSTLEASLIAAFNQSTDLTSKTNIGLYAGNASNIRIKDSTIGIGAKIKIAKESSNSSDTSTKEQDVRIGGLVGYAGIMQFECSKDTTYSANFDISGQYKTLNVGWIVGFADTFNYDLAAAVYIGGGSGLSFNNITDDKIAQMAVEASAGTYVGGIIGQAKTITPQTDTTTTSVGNDGAMAFNGDIKINQTTTSGNVNVGGVVGYINGEATIQNISVGGTISFGGTGDAGTTYYIGGAVGYNTEAAITTLKDVYVSTDIELSGDGSKSYTPLTNKAQHFIGGVVGQTQSSIELDVISLATIYMLYDRNNTTNTPSIDAIGNILPDEENKVEFTGSGAVYVSNINLCVSKHEDGAKIVNQTYSDAKGEMDNEVVKELINFAGSKTNPLWFSDLIRREQSDANYQVVIDDQITITGNHNADADHKRRRVYSILDKDIELIEDKNKHSINLENVMLFSDGNVIYSELTPFNTIDSTSAVSGVVSKVYIKEATETASLAGFVNNNKGVIYTCSVQEPLAYFENKDSDSIKTQFYSYIELSKSSVISGGFVAQNSGYIFGSNSNTNIHLSTNTGYTIGGFVGKNNGLIDYCYSSGYVSNTKGAAFTSLDLFGQNEEKGLNTNSYTIFANTTENQSGIKSSAIYEMDASEVVAHEGTAKTLFGELGGLKDENKYYAVSTEFNANYPYLGKLTEEQKKQNANNPFGGMTYLARNSKVIYTKDTETGMYWYDHKTGIQGESGHYYIIPTIAAFEAMDSNGGELKENCYVLTRELNLGYNIENNIRAYGEDEAGDNISEFSNILDGYGNAIKNANLNKVNLFELNSGTIKNINIKNISLNASTGFIGTNNGTLDNIKIYENINISTEGIDDYAYSILVSENRDTIKNVELEATIEFNGACSSWGYAFGCIAGRNYANIENCLLRNTTLIIKEINLTGPEDNGVTYPDELIVGGIVGRNSGAIIASGIKSTNIAAVNKGILKLGGIVGFAEEDSQIEQCYVDQPEEKEVSNIIGGSDHETNELVPETYRSKKSDSEQNTEQTSQVESGLTDVITEEAYVGGVVGYSVSGVSINNCQNCGNIVSRARWKAAKNASGNYEEERYKYSEELYQIVMYVYMESLAHAGGISSNDAEINYCKNFGEVRGGFKAWKPVAYIANNGNGTFKTNQLLAWGSAGASVVGTGALATGATFFGIALHGALAYEGMALSWSTIGTCLTTGSAGGPVGLIITGVVVAAVAVGLAINSAIEKNRLETVSVQITHIPGNSNFKVAAIDDKGELDVESKDTDGYEKNMDSEFSVGSMTDNNSFNIRINASVIDAVQYAESARMYGQDDYSIVGEKMTGETRRHGLFASPIHVKKIDEVSYGSYEGLDGKQECYGYFDNDKYLTYEDAIKWRDWDYGDKKVNTTKLSKVLEKIYYDPICPALTGSNLNLESQESNHDVMSTNYGTTGKKAVRLHTGAKYSDEDDAHKSANSYLEFESGIDALKPKYTITNTPEFDSDYWDSDGLLVASPEPVKFKEISEGGKTYLEYTLTDAKLWEGLVSTVNKGIVDVTADANGKLQGTTATDNPYIKQNVRIILDIPNESSQKIVVGNNTFNEFNGTIIAKGGEYFSGMKMYIENSSTDIGLIKKSNSAILENIRIEGSIVVNYEQNGADETKYKNMGLLIGSVEDGGSGVQIKNPVISVEMLETNNYAEHFISSFGGIVGHVKGKLTIEKPNVASVTSASLYAAETINFAKSALPTANGMGGIIGTVAESGQVAINEAISTMSILSVCAINSVGGLVGSNFGRLTISANTTVDTLGINVASTGDAYAGGIIGFNKGTLSISGNVDICTSVAIGYSKTISADVLDGTKKAYAGGVIGYTDASSPYGLSANIRVGSSSALSSYHEALYVVAGTNAYVLSNGLMAIPTEAYANKFVGNGEVSDNNIHASSVITKKVAIENNFDSATIKNNLANLQWTTVPAATVNGFGSLKFDANGYSIGFSQNEEVDDDGNVVQQKIYNYTTYSLKSRIYKVDPNKAESDTVYEYYLNYQYIDKSGWYKKETAKVDVTDKNTGESGQVPVDNYKKLGTLNIDINMSYLIRIIEATNLGSSNEYMVQIILLNYGNVLNCMESLNKGIDFNVSNNYTGTLKAEAGVNNPTLLQAQKFSLGTKDVDIPLGQKAVTEFAPTGQEIIIPNTLNWFTTKITSVLTDYTEFTLEKEYKWSAIQRMLYSSNTFLKVTNGGVELIETLTVRELEQKGQVNVTTSTVENTIEFNRTLFSLDLPSVSNAGIEYKATAISKGKNSTYDSYLSGYYNNTALVSTTEYTKDNTVILSAVVGVGTKGADGKYSDYDVYEWVLVAGREVVHMSYRLSKAAYSGIDFKKRLESYMPVWTSGTDKYIYDIIYEFD